MSFSDHFKVGTRVIRRSSSPGKRASLPYWPDSSLPVERRFLIGLPLMENELTREGERRLDALSKTARVTSHSYSTHPPTFTIPRIIFLFFLSTLLVLPMLIIFHIPLWGWDIHFNFPFTENCALKERVDFFNQEGDWIVFWINIEVVLEMEKMSSLFVCRFPLFWEVLWLSWLDSMALLFYKKKREMGSGGLRAWNDVTDKQFP